MTEEFRTIADRTTGDGDPRAIDIRPGDRVTFGASQGPGLPEVVRIEKPVAEHDHRDQPRVWCTRCQHEHIAEIPATTYMCDSCGFGQWDLGTAAVHEASTPGHRTYPVAHPTVPLDERPPVPTAAGVLHEVITRLDEARYANGGTTSPWGNTDVLELLAHLRQPYTEGGATAVSLPTRDEVAAVVKRAGDAWSGPSMDEFRDDPPTRRHYAIADAVLALFSQPTPTAEPEHGWDACSATAVHAPHEWNVEEGEVGYGSRCPGSAEPEHDEACIIWTGDGFTCDCGNDDDSRAEPPRIEDMAPGTTFTAAAAEDVWRWAVRADGLIVSGRGFAHRSVIDPSTIRDVTPPKGDDRG